MYNGDMDGVIAGFEWDRGNLEKCRKHGVSTADIENMLIGEPRMAPDLKHSEKEARFIAVGRSLSGRLMFVAFTIREMEGKKFIRPVTARYMHKKESERYEETESS